MYPVEKGDLGGWTASAQAWLETQGEEGDWSRRAILDSAVEEMLGDVNGKEILDIGCGDGRYCRVMAGKGALTTGIDPTEAFISRARELHPDGSYVLGFAEDLPFLDNHFDMALSYVALVDIPDLDSAVAEMARVVKPGGILAVATIANYCCVPTPWIKDSQGRKLYRPVDGYMDEKAIHCAWNGISIVNYHRPLSKVLSAFLGQGLTLVSFDEPLPDLEDPHYEQERRAPNFQTYSWRKPL